MTRSMKKEPRERATVQQLLCHPFIAKHKDVRIAEELQDIIRDTLEEHRNSTQLREDPVDESLPQSESDTEITPSVDEEQDCPDLLVMHGDRLSTLALEPILESALLPTDEEKSGGSRESPLMEYKQETRPSSMLAQKVFQLWKTDHDVDSAVQAVLPSFGISDTPRTNASSETANSGVKSVIKSVVLLDSDSDSVGDALSSQSSCDNHTVIMDSIVMPPSDEEDDRIASQTPFLSINPMPSGVCADEDSDSDNAQNDMSYTGDNCSIVNVTDSVRYGDNTVSLLMEAITPHPTSLFSFNHLSPLITSDSSGSAHTSAHSSARTSFRGAVLASKLEEMMETVEESERDQVSAKATSISPLSLRSHSPTNAVAEVATDGDVIVDLSHSECVGGV